MREEAAELKRIGLLVREKLESYSSTGEVVGMGADGTPTLDVDRAVEETIIESTEERFNLLSEECGYLDRGADWTVIADPVDGTRNMIRGIPFYCTSLALLPGEKDDIGLDRVFYGMVLNLALNELFESFRGEGALLNGKTLKGVPSKKVGNLVSLTTREIGDLGKRLKGWNIRALGAAALEMCYVASGKLDIYYNDGKGLRITDIAASSLILREVGGEIYDLTSSGRLKMGPSLAERAKVLAAREEVSGWLN